MIRTTFRHRCPACGEGRLFRRGYTMYRRCATCGLDLEGEHGAHYGGPIIFGYTIGGIAGLAVFGLLFWRNGFEPYVTWVAVAAAILAILLTFRHCKAFWTWWLYRAGELEHAADRASGGHVRPTSR